MNTFNFIWNRQSGFPARTSKTHGNSLLNTDFLLEKFACKNSDSLVIEGEASDIPPFACKFAAETYGGRDLLAVATEEGEIMILNAVSGSQKLVLDTLPAHNNAIFDLSWIHGKPLILSGSGDHTVALFDVPTSEKIATFVKHSATVKSIDSCPTQPAVFASGSRDGTILVWDMRVGSIGCSAGHIDKPDIIISEAHTQSACGSCISASTPKRKKAKANCQLRSVTTVTFQDEFNLASAGVSDSTVKIWDLRKTYITTKSTPMSKQSFYFGEKKPLLHGCSSLQFDSTKRFLFACCTNNTIAKFDCYSSSNQSVSSYYGFRATSYFIKMSVSPDDQYIVCGSGDNKAHIWNVSQPGAPLVSLSGHTAEVTAVHWHPKNFTKIATCSDDNSVCLWNITGPNDPASLTGSASHVDVEKLDPDIVAKFNETSPVQLTPQKTKLKERSLTEFFRPTGPCSPNEGLKSLRTIENKESREVVVRSNILQSSHNILMPSNRKRKTDENEMFNGTVSSENSHAVTSTSQLSSFVLKDNNTTFPEDKENNNSSLQKENSVKNLFYQKDPSTRERIDSSPSTSKKICRRLSLISPRGKKDHKKDGKRSGSLITNYFQARCLDQ